MVLLFMRNGRYGLVFHENHPPYKHIQDSNKTLEDTFLISYKKSPVRFLVALNTLDKFIGCHAHVLCVLQISDMNVLYRLKKRYTCVI